MSKYVRLVAISVCMILVGINATAVSVAFPVLTSSFGASLVQASWVLTSYTLVFTACMPLAGKATDIFGTKPIFIACMLVFSIGSALCALAPNIQFLIAARFIQGAGSAATMPVAIGIFAETFPERRQQFIGLISSIYPIGQIIGPSLGGWLVANFGWRSVFWFSAPLGLAVLLFALLTLNSSPRKEGRLDMLGAGLFTGSIFALLTGLTQFGRPGTNAPSDSSGIAVLLLAAGAALVLLFVRHASRAKDPIIDWQLLKGRPFLISNAYNMVFGAGYFCLVSYVPLYAVSVYGLSTVESGLVLTPWSVGVSVAAAITSFFLLRWGYRRPIVVGTAILALSIFLMSLEPHRISLFGAAISDTALLGSIMALAGIGIGIAMPAANNACIELMPERVSSISGVRAMFRNTGGAAAVAVTSIILNNVGIASGGFAIVFTFLAIVLVVGSPLIFGMPASPGERLSRKPAT